MSETRSADAGNSLAPDQQLRLMARLRERMRARVPMPDGLPCGIAPAMYLDADWLAKEQAELFATRPLIVGHVAMLPKPGDHFTHDHLGKPLLVVRGADGVIRAFLNVCRHRGMRLVASTDGANRPSFVCPYHNWVYGLDGRLKHAPLAEAFEGADLGCRSLRPLVTSVECGFIWVQLDNARPIDTGAWLATLNDDHAAFATAEHVVYRRSASVRACNWKLIVEAFQDGYHVVRLHRNSVGPFFTDSEAVSERVGEHLRAAVARREFADVIDAPPAHWMPRVHASFVHYIFPNTIIIFHPDYISQLGLFPQAIDRTLITHTCLIPAAPRTDKESEHWRRSFELIENGVFQAEDYFVCEGIQAGLASGANETLLLGAHEEGILMFHEILCDTIGEYRPARPGA